MKIVNEFYLVKFKFKQVKPDKVVVLLLYFTFRFIPSCFWNGLLILVILFNIQKIYFLTIAAQQGVTRFFPPKGTAVSRWNISEETADVILFFLLDDCPPKSWF